MVTHFDNQHFQNNQLTLNKTINEMFEFINELYTKNTNILEIIQDVKYELSIYLNINYDKIIADDKTSYSFSKFTPQNKKKHKRLGG